MYEGVVWEVIQQVIEGNPMAVSPPLGDEKRQLNVTQSLLQGA